VNRVILVCGAPGSGKSAYVAQRFRRGQDMVCDYDRIMSALSDQPEHHGARALHFFALAAVESIYARLGQQRDGLDTAWVIACLPGERARKQMAQRLGAREIVLVQTPEEICVERVAQRVGARADGVTGITQWFECERRADSGTSESSDPSRVLAKFRTPALSIQIVKGTEK
jgi:dephospho-CoA kinase